MLESARKRLKAAEKKGDPWEIGYEHLEVAYALIQQSSEWKDHKKDCKEALTQADQAIDVFSGIPHPGGIASAHLARGSIYTQLAEGEENDLKKVANLDLALSSCLAAQDALKADGVNTGQIFDIYSSVSVLLLLMRELIDDQDFIDQLDELIQTNSQLLGQAVAEDVKARAEGNATLYTAQMIGALAELEEDQAEKEDLLAAQGLLAVQASHLLDGAGDTELIDQALKVYQQTWSELEETLPKKGGK